MKCATVKNLCNIIGIQSLPVCHFRSESPSQVFLIVLTWLHEILKNKPVEEWEKVRPLIYISTMHSQHAEYLYSK